MRYLAKLFAYCHKQNPLLLVPPRSIWLLNKGSSLCEQLQCIIKVVKNKARNGGASRSHVHPGKRFDILSQPVQYQVQATVSGHQQLLMLA